MRSQHSPRMHQWSGATAGVVLCNPYNTQLHLTPNCSIRLHAHVSVIVMLHLENSNFSSCCNYWHPTHCYYWHPTHCHYRHPTHCHYWHPTHCHYWHPTHCYCRHYKRTIYVAKFNAVLFDVLSCLATEQ